MNCEQKFIEIPFGAKDSELKGWEYTIPENMEAIVKDGKVIIREKESEDERIRKALIDGVRQIRCKNGITQEQMIAYLEKQKEPEDKGEISDGYHTFNELYYYRMLYNASFFNELAYKSDNGHWDVDYGVHKSKRHHDGEECFGGGWFIVMANLPTGQISNHYELKYWDLFQIPEKETADEWDGHTPREAAERLHKYLLGKEQKSVDLVDEIKHKLKTIPADVLAQTYIDHPEYFNGQVKNANSSDEEFSSMPKNAKLSMLTEDYVSFETAKLLKEKGIEYDQDESYWLIDADNKMYWVSRIGAYDYVDNPTDSFQRPKNGYRLVTQAVAMKWLREVHGLDIDISIEYASKKVYYYSILKKTAIRDIDCLHSETNFKSYEESCEAAVKYCLENLV